VREILPNSGCATVVLSQEILQPVPWSPELYLLPLFVAFRHVQDRELREWERRQLLLPRSMTGWKVEQISLALIVDAEVLVRVVNLLLEDWLDLL
jgi:hypothetical protein